MHYFRCLLAIMMLSAGLNTYALAQQKMPALQFKDTELSLVGIRDIPKDKALLLIYFRSDCDHCIHTAQTLKGNTGKYPATIWMVSAETIEELRMFEDMTEFYDVANLRVLQDHTQSMHRWYDFSQLPFIVLFDKKGNQVKTYKELPAAAMVKKDLGL